MRISEASETEGEGWVEDKGGKMRAVVLVETEVMNSDVNTSGR